MRRIQAATVIAAPLERVFALLAPAEQAHWYSPGARVEVRDLSSGPVGKGSTWTIVERSRFGSDAMRIEVTAYEPPTRYQSRATASMFT
ncbi:MAG: SRPBCC family protein, partial [Actinobacteria bacterium]|nr:SRPBCC family protein [Actinomycetota bacterium]